MLSTIDTILRHNYQKISTNRFVVDSPRFWREEFHPRFKDIFEHEEFKNVFLAAHEMISYKFKDEYLDLMATNLYNYFSGYRFCAIPKKDPQSPQQFLSDLYFVLIDILPSISFKDFPLIQDDFNLVYHEANEGKKDNSKTATNEFNQQDSHHESKLDILSESNQETNNSSGTENVDDESWQNNKTVADVFLSPQNQGVTPTIINTEFAGVNGVPMMNESPYTTNTAKTNFGESNKAQSNTSQQAQESRERLTQNNDARTTHASDTQYHTAQEQMNAGEKTADYKETLDFNRGARLQDFFDLTNVRHWKEIIARLQIWVLQVKIATAEGNYNDCEFFD